MSIEIDSLRVKIELPRVKILNPSLSEKLIIVSRSTGDIVGNTKSKRTIIDDCGGSVHYWIDKSLIAKGIQGEFLFILFSSKIIREKYFNGITKDNIKYIYDRLMSHKEVSFNLDTFLNSQTEDIDFKLDCRPKIPFIELISRLQSITKRSNRKNSGCNVFTKDPKNTGIEWSTRENKSMRSNPFLKGYDKEKELMYHSNEFYSQYLQSEDIKGIVRFETTIKNKRHLESFGITDTKLNTLLNLPIEIKKEFFSKAFHCHLNSNKEHTKMSTGKDKIDPSKSTLLRLLTGYMKDANLSYYQIKDYALEGLERQSYRRQETTLDSLYQNHIRGTELNQNRSFLDNFLKEVGLV